MDLHVGCESVHVKNCRCWGSPLKLKKTSHNVLSYLDKQEGVHLLETLSKPAEIVKDLPRGGGLFLSV